jgi:hypothetical protein
LGEVFVLRSESSFVALHHQTIGVGHARSSIDANLEGDHI